MSPTITQSDLAQGRSRMEGLRDASLHELTYRDEQNVEKHRLVIVIGSEQGERAVFSFPEKLGTALDVWPLNNRLARAVCEELDARAGVIPSAAPTEKRRGIGG